MVIGEDSYRAVVEALGNAEKRIKELEQDKGMEQLRKKLRTLINEWREDGNICHTKTADGLWRCAREVETILNGEDI